MKIRGIFLVLLAVGYSLLATGIAEAQFGQFGKNNVRWDDKEYRFYQSYHFDIWHTFNDTDPEQLLRLEELAGTLEIAYVWMSSEKVFGHSVETRIPVIVRGTHREFEVEVGRMLGEFMPEGVGALVDAFRHRMVTKRDYESHKLRAIDTHELVHVFQYDIETISVVVVSVWLRPMPSGYCRLGAFSTAMS